jgi:protein tyrosine/serine phosphatase
MKTFYTGNGGLGAQGSCIEIGGDMKTFTRIIGVPGLHNLGVVRDGAVYRSAQPDYTKNWSYEPQTGTGLRINSVLNLREESEAEEAEAHALKYFQLRLNVLSDVTVKDFDLIVITLSNPENQPILVHCLSGADRTGIACAAYRMAVDGWALAEALEEMKEYGAHYFIDPVLIGHLTDYAEAKGYPK